MGGTGISSAGASVLTSQDLAALAVPLNGLLSDQEVVVSGLFCGNGLQGRGCNPESRMGVHTSRYGLNEGLHEQASVSFSGSNVGALELSLTLRIQDTEGKDSTLSGSVRAIEVRVKTEAREGRNLRVVEVKTGDFEVRPGDRLRKVHARIVWDVSNADEPVLLPESSVSFARKSVATSTLPWNFAAPSAVGPTDPAIIADEIGYSMSIEKAR